MALPVHLRGGGCVAWPVLQLGVWRGAVIILELHLSVCQQRIDLCSQGERMMEAQVHCASHMQCRHGHTPSHVLRVGSAAHVLALCLLLLLQVG